MRQIHVIVCGYGKEFYRGHFLRQVASNNIVFHWPFDGPRSGIFVLRNISRIFRILLASFRFRSGAVLFLPSEENQNIFYALLAKYLIGLPLVSEFYLSLTLTGLDWGWFSGFRGRLFRLKAYICDWLIIRLSDVVLPLTRYEFDMTCKYLNVKRHKAILELPLCVDDRAYRQTTKPSSKSFTVCYWGSFVPLHGLERIIYAFEDKVLSHCRLIIYGPLGSRYEKFHSLVQSRGLNDRIQFRCGEPYSSQSWVGQVLDECDLALGIFGDSFKADIVIPNKVVDALGMGIPVLTKDTGAMAAEFGLEGFIYRCANDSRTIAESIHRISKMKPDDVKMNCSEGRRYFSKKFSPVCYINSLNEIFRNIASIDRSGH